MRTKKPLILIFSIIVAIVVLLTLVLIFSRQVAIAPTVVRGIL